MTIDIFTCIHMISHTTTIDVGLCPDSHLKYLEFQTSSHGQGFPDCPSTLSLVVSENINCHCMRNHMNASENKGNSHLK
jgi:hypothetical protein